MTKQNKKKKWTRCEFCRNKARYECKFCGALVCNDCSCDGFECPNEEEHYLEKIN